MGQYYLGYVNHNGKIKVFDNKVDVEYNGLKLMEHSYWKNNYVGQVVNDLFYNKGRACWVGDYYDEDDYSQVNCNNKELVKSIGWLVWDEKSKIKKTEGTKHNARRLTECILVNHTKRLYIVCKKYFENNKWIETYDGVDYEWCIHPLPLLTCSGNHSGGSYYGINQDLCGTWFYDELEVVYDYEEEDLKTLLEYKEFEPRFSERQ